MSLRVRIALTPPLAVALLAPACANDWRGPDESAIDNDTPGGGDTASAARFAGRTFLSTEVTEADGRRTLVDGTVILLEFPDTNHIVAFAGCNTITGDVTIEVDMLTAGQLTTTEMACDTDIDEQTTWLGDFLAHGPAYDLDGDTLRLTVDDTTIELVDRETADQGVALEDTVWQIDGFVDGEAVASIATDPPATLVFSDGRLTVADTGCNSATGTADIAEAAITIGEVIWTRLVCGEPAATIERVVSEVLAGTITYEIEAGALTLTRPGGKGLTLRAREPVAQGARAVPRRRPAALNDEPGCAAACGGAPAEPAGR